MGSVEHDFLSAKGRIRTVKKWMFIVILIVIALAGLKITWDYLIPSQDIKQSFKNLKADASGLDRTITHCVNQTDCMTWKGMTKIYPFPDVQSDNGVSAGSGAAFSFTLNGKKIICGPGWRIIEN